MSRAISRCSCGGHKKGNKVHKWCCAALWSRWTRRRGRNPGAGGRTTEGRSRTYEGLRFSLSPRNCPSAWANLVLFKNILDCEKFSLDPLRIVMFWVGNQNLKNFSSSILHCWKRVNLITMVYGKSLNTISLAFSLFWCCQWAEEGPHAGEIAQKKQPLVTFWVVGGLGGWWHLEEPGVWSLAS